MSLDAAIRALEDNEPYKAGSTRGRVGSEGLFGLVRALRRIKQSGAVLAPVKRTATAVTATAASHILQTSACTLYGLYVISPSGSTLGVIVKALDGATVAVASLKCASTKDAEAWFYAGTDGVGIPIATDLRVIATQAADGSTVAAAGDRPTVVAIIGI